MKALICSIPGVFEYRDIGMPELPEDYTLLKIKRIGICGTDLHAFEGTQPFFNYPRILGHEIAAEIVATQTDSNFSIGELVTVSPYFYCGKCIACRNGLNNCCESIQVCGVHVDGGMREYLAVPTYSLIHGDGLSEDELALVEPLAIGAHGVRRTAVKPNEFVLVIGAGPIGLGTMEFARIAGAQVIAMDINEQRLQFCKEQLKIEFTVNALLPDAEEKIRSITNADMPTVVIDCTGNLHAINNAFRYMSHGARFVLIGLQRNEISFSHPEFHKREATLMSSRNAIGEDFIHVIDSMKKGLIRPTNYITHRVNFEEVKNNFASWLDPANGVIKAMVTMS
jgi:2-desacetyl-2-hydroxyethyl bacteriochlorophyllide A dehydrogenase